MLETATLGWILFGSLVFIGVSAFLGDHHVEIGGDIGHGGVGFGGDTHHGVTTWEIFNFRNLALLAAGFSAASIIARNADVGEFGTNLAGLGGAIVMLAVGVWLFRVIRRQESNSITSTADLVGKAASVTVGIPQHGLGEISVLNAQGVTTSLSAKTKGEEIIPVGTEVKIVAVAGNTATVATQAA